MSAASYKLEHARESTHRDANSLLVERRQGVEHELDEILQLARRDDMFPAGRVKGVDIDAATSRISSCDGQVLVVEEDEGGKGRGEVRGRDVNRFLPPLLECEVCGSRKERISESAETPLKLLLSSSPIRARAIAIETQVVMCSSSRSRPLRPVMPK